ncbi:unnamed protein product [Rhodiola kirilowii]
MTVHACLHSSAPINVQLDMSYFHCLNRLMILCARF